MAEVRLNRLCKDFDLGLNTIVDFLNKNGFYVELNPNAKVDSMCIPLLKEHFGIPAKEDVPKAVPNNFPLIGSKYNNNPFGKKILLLDGFYDEVSSTVLEGYKAGLQTFPDRNDQILMLYGISRTFCQMYDGLNNELDFIDCCAFYSCDCSLVTQNEFNEQRQRIYAIIDAYKPDVVFMLSEDLSTLFHMNLGIEYYGHMYATQNKRPNGHVSDFIYVINPLWLDERDIKLFFEEDKDSAQIKDDIYYIPEDIFTRPERTRSSYITASIHDDIKSDLAKFREFIKFICSLSLYSYSRRDVKTLLRILTGYPFDSENEQLLWDARKAHVLFYVVKGMFKKNHGAYKIIAQEVLFEPNAPTWITRNDITKYFVSKTTREDKQTANKLHEFYKNHYKSVL